MEEENQTEKERFITDGILEPLLQAAPIKEKTEALCEAIAGQPEFKTLYTKIEAFMNDEKLKYEYGLLNDRGALLEQKQQHGVEVARRLRRLLRSTRFEAELGRHPRADRLQQGVR